MVPDGPHDDVLGYHALKLEDVGGVHPGQHLPLLNRITTCNQTTRRITRRVLDKSLIKMHLYRLSLLDRIKTCNQTTRRITRRVLD